MPLLVPALTFKLFNFKSRTALLQPQFGFALHSSHFKLTRKLR